VGPQTCAPPHPRNGSSSTAELTLLAPTGQDDRGDVLTRASAKPDGAVVRRTGRRAQQDESRESEPVITEDAFAGFCARVRPRLVGALALHCGDRGAAEELAQEALARAWERWAQVRQMQNPSAWTYRVAFNLATSRFRRRAAESRARQRSMPVAPALPDHAQAVAVRAAVAALPPRRRTALVLRYYLDL
jgi:RNA polymerase sigma factor (sigma-70 family)